MNLFADYAYFRYLLTVGQHEEVLEAQRQTPVPAADRPRDGRPPAVRRVVGMALVRMGERLEGARAAEVTVRLTRGI